MPARNWYSIQAKKGEPSAVEISIHDEIGGWGVTAKDFIAALKDAGEVSAIHLSVHSPGGSVLDGWAVYNVLKNHAAPVTSTVEGFAGSMASVIIQAADEIRMPENAYIMIHNPWTVAAGDADDLDSIAETMRKIETGIVRVYMDASGLPEGEVRAMMDKETFMDGPEAVEKGFAHTLLAEQKAAAVAEDWQARFKNFPVGLTRQTEKPKQSKPDKAMPDGNKPNAAPVAAQPTPAVAPNVPDREAIKAEIEKERTSERTRIRAIESVGSRFGVDQKEIDAAIDNGTSIDGFRATVMDNFNPAAVSPQGGESAMLGAGPKERHEYSVVKAIREMAVNGELSGFEKEVQQELSNRFQDSTGEAPRGILLPGEVTHGQPGNSGRADRIRAAQTAGTTTAGGHTIQTDYGPLISYLEEFALAPRLGATFLRDLTGNVKFPRVASGYTATWDAETDTISASDAVFGETTLSPKRVGGGANISLQLLKQSSLDIEAWVRRRLARDLANAIDRAAFTGPGTDAPTGLLSASGTTAYAFATGADLLHDVAAIWGDVRASKAPMAAAAWLSSPVTTEDWMTEPEVSGYPSFVLKGNPKMEQTVLGYPYHDHTDITGNKVIFGDFAYVLIGLWGGIDLVVDPYTAKSSGQVQVFANAYADTDLEQPGAFVVSSNAGTAHS